MGIFFAIWRRLFGGADSKIKFLRERGIQMIISIIVVFLWEYLVKHKVWWLSLTIAILVYIFWCIGHWYYFKCGTEDDSYIDEELSKGRKPAMNWIVAPINKWLGFQERSVHYCFIGLMIRYFFWGSLVSLALHDWNFATCAFTIPFIYNACFWIKLPKWWKMDSPTNWAEFFNGLVIGWSLM